MTQQMFHPEESKVTVPEMDPGPRLRLPLERKRRGHRRENDLDGYLRENLLYTKWVIPWEETFVC